MSELKKIIKAEDLDAALQQIEKSFSETKITLEKSVDKRAMGGDQKVETGNEVISAPGNDRTHKPVVGEGTRSESKLQGNWAEKYPMDAAQEEGLEGAIKNSAKAPTRDKDAVNKSTEGAAEPGETEKAIGQDKVEGKEPIHKAADQSDESSDIVKAADKSDSISTSTSMKKAATPPEQSAESSGASSGAPQLKKSMKLVASAKKHLAKAYEGGSDSELEIAGDRLISAKSTILKAIKDGEKVPSGLVKSLDKAAKHYGKALASFENDKIEEHVKSVEKADKYMVKALSAYDFQKSTVVEKSITSPEVDTVKFIHKDGKVTAEMTSEQFKKVEKALTEKGIYKSFLDTVSKEQKQTIDALPILKSLVDGLKNSQNELRDNLVAVSEKDNEFKKSVTEALTILAKTSKQNITDIETLKDAPKVRKSVLTEVKSPLDGGEKSESSIEKAQVTEILEKGIRKGLCDKMVLLSWDVDKDLPVEYQEKYMKLCEKIQRG